ncbi:sensor histidine kinase [Nocardiopsis alkaliphila]|uniref:sensor histidine kinase n=1 Tax=Nocardiopsis alkaliphila TaxID=225762 RepID=UPI000349FD9B|nr:ATP-binding protein [Nocardiopsis alkaliphila]
MRKTHASTRTIRGQITRIVLIPSLCFLALWLIVTSIGAVQSAQQMRAVGQTRQGTEVLSAAMAELRAERRLSMAHLGAQDGGETSTVQEDLDRQRTRSDEAVENAAALVAELDGGDDQELRQGAEEVLKAPEELTRLRGAVDEHTLGRDEVLVAYGGLIDSLQTTSIALIHTTDGGENLADAVLARELVNAREDYATADALLTGVIAAGRMTYEETAHFTFLTASYRATLDGAIHTMPSALRSDYEAITQEASWMEAERLARRVVTRPPVAEGVDAAEGEPLSEWNSTVEVEADEWDASSTPSIEALDTLTKAQTEHTVDLAWNASLLRMWLYAAGAALSLLGGAIAIALVGRSSRRLSGRLSALREQILERDLDLPDIIERAQHGHKVDVVDELPPLDEQGDDEIGQVAEAFDSAQITAVEAAVRQAEIRRGANRAFLGIAFRNQALLQRQLRLLDEIEYNEQDPQALRRLFRLDHLATRARRYADNLIILGGGQSVRRWRQPRPLLDVLRAAIAETEDFERVRLTSAPRVLIHGQAVADIVHLLAELVENATQFSPTGTPVDVGCAPTGGGLLVEIEDRGLGMSEQGYAAAERTLTQPPEFDVMALPDEPRLGLFVVARLAERHGVRVWLRPSPYGGTRAIALIPDRLLEPVDNPLTVSGAADIVIPVPPGHPTGTGPVPNQPVPDHLVPSHPVPGHITPHRAGAFGARHSSQPSGPNGHSGPDGRTPFPPQTPGGNRER